MKEKNYLKKPRSKMRGNTPLIDMDNLKDLIYKYISCIKVDLIKKTIKVEYNKKSFQDNKSWIIDILIIEKSVLKYISTNYLASTQ